MKLTTFLLSMPWVCFSAMAQPAKTSDSCELRSSCTPCATRSCSTEVDTRSCRIRFPFAFSTTISDPSCEAARAAQNTLYQLQKADCERINQQLTLACSAQLERCISVASTCDAIKRRYPQTVQRKHRILWVDDNPNNNLDEQKALAKLGAELVLVQSTTDALKAISRERFDIVLSDFSRRDDPQGGYTLLTELRKSSSTKSTPYIIFSSASNVESVADAKSRGVYTQTNRPDELLQSIFQAMSKSRPQ